MPQSSKTLVIGGDSFILNQWGPDRVLDLAPDVAQMFIEPMIMGATAFKDLSSPESTETLVRAISLLTTRLKDRKPSAFFRMVLSETFCIGSSTSLGDEANFKQFFSGRAQLAVTLVAETLKYQYADFFPALLALVPQAHSASLGA